MAETFYSILTNVGKAKIAMAAALGTDINITQFAVGDGNGAYYNPTEDQTALKHEVWRGNATSINVDSQNPNWIVAESIIIASEGGFMIREAGIFDADGDMIAVGKYPETYKPLIEEGSAKDLNVKMIIEVSNASSVTLKINPSVLFATKDELNNLAGAGRTTETVKGNADAIKAYKQDYEYQTPTVTGTQIQLIKKSDTKILKFKLDADLTGGNITISTDAGETDQLLVDTDGTQVTSLEKGFVEVVADADFFTLRNKGGISPGQKQDLIDIANEAEENNSTTKSNIIFTINTKLNKNLPADSTWSDINNSINDVDLSNLIPSNIKKYVNINGVSGSYTFNYWTITQSLKGRRTDLAGCGAQSSALAFGGRYNEYLNTTEKFNGISWASTAVLNQIRYSLAGCGAQSSALAFGGDSGSGIVETTEKFNGSTWATTGSSNVKRFGLAGCGSQDAGLSFGGHNGTNQVATTEKFNGNTWSITGNMSSARYNLAGCGTQSAGLSFGGTTGNTLLATTEKFNGTTWSTTGNLGIGRQQLAGFGDQISAVSCGGQISYPHVVSTAEKFNGVGWWYTGFLNLARFGLAGCGTQSAGLSFGGADGKDTVEFTEWFSEN